MRARISKIFAVWPVLVVLLLTGCSDDSPATPEDEIRSLIERAVEMAENRDRDELMGMVADSFSGPRGLSHKTLDSTLQLYFFRHRNIHLFTKIEAIVLHGANDASVGLFVAMAGSAISDQSVLGSLRARIYRFDLTLHKEQDWRVTEASWQPAKLADVQRTY